MKIPMIIQAQDFEGDNLALLMVTNPDMTQEQAVKLVSETFDSAFDRMDESVESYVDVAVDKLTTHGIVRVFTIEVMH